MQRGYTLWEMLVVLSLIVIVSHFLFSNYSILQQKMRADLVIWRLYQSIVLTRSTAIRYHSPVTLCPFDAATKKCGEVWLSHLLLFRDDQGDGILRQKEQIIRMIDLSEKEGAISWSSFRKKHYLQFSPNGFTDYLNGTFVYCPKNKDPHYARAIFIHKNGSCRFSVASHQDGIHQDSEGKPLVCA